LVLVATIGLGVVFLVEHVRTPDSDVTQKMVFLIIASALLPAGVLWVVEHTLLLSPLLKEAKSMIEDIRTSIGRADREIRAGIEDATMLDSFKRCGLHRASPSRESLVKEVLQHSVHDNTISDIIIVGSTLDGLTKRAPWFREFIEDAKTSGKHLRLVFTHWDFVSHREKQEDRPAGAIAQELLYSLSKVLHWGIPPESIRLAYGAPTVFMVVAGSDMILNPYPYGAESVTSLTIWLKNTHPEKPEGVIGSVWNQYYESHYKMAWDPPEPEHSIGIGDGRRISCPLPKDWKQQISERVRTIQGGQNLS
jgi:hypothetical protein